MKEQKEAQSSSWRKPNVWDAQVAHRLRKIFGALGYYPTEERPSLKPHRPSQVTNIIRMIYEMDDLDLFALYNVARFLAVAPRKPGLFRQIKAGRPITIHPTL